jgi:hypothetical protein
MNGMLEPAKLFFDACETGKGWDLCKDYCHAEKKWGRRLPFLRIKVAKFCCAAV